jgi:hypothetical protein
MSCAVHAFRSQKTTAAEARFAHGAGVADALSERAIAATDSASQCGCALILPFQTPFGRTQTIR